VLVGGVELLLAEGRAAEALEAAEEYSRRHPTILNPALAPWLTLKGEALARLGRRDEALALAHEELPLSRSWGAPDTVARTLRVIGTIAGDEEGLEQLQEAAETVAGSAARLEEARTLAAYGGALRRLRRPTEAREPLRRALELADACGARTLVEHARADLYASGARPRTTAVRGVGALTASERRVVTLAVDGQSNRDIAQTLFVTPKTVEVHLSNAYRKLGVRSRRELGAALDVA
jgi:DNA-binding CsgD family transcriptional regulator